MSGPGRPPPRLNGGSRSTGRAQARKSPLSAAERAAKEHARELYVQRTYGVTPERQHQLTEHQQEAGLPCWGCGRATGASKALAMDHNHRTGEARMWLCSTCNQLVGHFRDNPVTLIRLGLALIQPPSRAAWTAPGRPEPGWWCDDPDLEAWLIQRPDRT